MRRNESQHGYTLAVVMVLLGVLSVMSAAAMKMSSSQMDASLAYTRDAKMQACADGARNLMLSNLRFGNAVPKKFSMVLTNQGPRDRVTLDPNEIASNATIVAGEEVLIDMGDGHDPGLTPAVRPEAIELIPGKFCGDGRTGAATATPTNDILPAGASGGSCQRIVARCRDKTGRTREVEFTVRYGF